MKKYKLLKDLPELKAGGIFEWNEINKCYRNFDNGYPIDSTIRIVEENKEWFEEVKEEQDDLDNILNNLEQSISLNEKLCPCMDSCQKTAMCWHYHELAKKQVLDWHNKECIKLLGEVRQNTDCSEYYGNWLTRKIKELKEKL